MRRSVVTSDLEEGSCLTPHVNNVLDSSRAPESAVFLAMARHAAGGDLIINEAFAF